MPIRWDGPGETKTVTIPAEIAGDILQPTGVMKIDIGHYYAEPSPADKEEEKVATSRYTSTLCW